ncbi:shieldin complex subunit 3 [Salarias fasciatus]|uniref:shieldin complex subunit 3 n=1 Tax=Salarias fasciatus TaxID=181472 RepID=UPI001176EA41|nr:shieldin complex subunit 3 [Salarias fasciatus]
MEEVFLHFQSGPPSRLPSLLRTAQNLLDPFPCRAAPVFTPWFPSSGQRPPLRPARPPPALACAGGGAEPEAEPAPLRLQPGRAEPVAEPAPPDRSPRRSWVVAARSRVPSQRSMSRRLRDTLSVHRLHPLQRARWVIHRENCGTGTDLEQTWRALCRAVRTAPLPSCTATIQRDRAEVWVFCDLEWAEHVGRRLKRALQLEGSIRLCVRTAPDILSM